MRFYIHQFTAWTAGAVFVMGVAVVATLAQPPSTLQNSFTSQVSSTLASYDDRAPASVPSDGQGRAAPQAVEIDLSCEGSSKFPNNVTQVRVSGSSCGAKRDIDSAEVMNSANGFSATVFFPDPKAFTTDYISLVSGQNDLKILLIFKNGEKEERTYPVLREP